MRENELLIIFATLIVSAKCQRVEVPVVQTAFGAVRGIYEETKDLNFFLYMGIPYARHPPGNIFGDAVDAIPWEGILVADNDHIYCPQALESNGHLSGTIDCLIVNVYVPAKRTSTEPLAVMFWLYGGNFLFGTADRYFLGPEFFVQKEVIFVTINYRVGPFGLLCLGTEDVPGNAGYKDIIKGLRWVRDNISGFGGDPNKVTIGGSSSGSIASEYVIASPLSDGLFQGAILQSGSVFTDAGSISDNHREHVLNMAHYFGYKGDSIKECVQFLQNVDPLAIYEYAVPFHTNYSICVEKNFPGVENFMPDVPAKIIESGEYTPVNVLVGFASKELAYTIYDILDESYATLFEDAVANFKFTSDVERSNVADILRSFYIGSQVITDAVRVPMEDLWGDYEFMYPSYRSAVYHNLQKVTVFLYRFDYSGGRDFYKTMKGYYDVTEPMHVDDLGYLFNSSLWPAEIEPNDKLMIHRITTLWTNFAKFGNVLHIADSRTGASETYSLSSVPDGRDVLMYVSNAHTNDPTPEVTELLPVKWLPFQNGGQHHFYLINTTMAAAVDIHRERFALWDLLYKAFSPYMD